MTIVEALEGFRGRGAGTDAERRTANWLADRCSGGGHDVVVETFWCRPNWALAHAWHVALAITGSLISLASPIAGITILAIALCSVASDAVAGTSLGRRLTPERASQNVIVSANHSKAKHGESAGRPTRLVLTANYDAARIGLAYKPWVRRATATLGRAVSGATPGWLGWLEIAILWLLALAVLRQAGHTSGAIGALQFVPTVALLLGFALLLEQGTGQWSPAAGDNGTGVAAALEVGFALAAAPPQNVEIELVLTGAGDGGQIGLRRYVRAGRGHRAGRLSLRREASGPRTIVIGFAACAAGRPRWWQSDGALIPLRSSASLRRTAEQIAQDEPHLEIGPNRGRGSSGAFAARSAGLSAITLGCLDRHGVASHSHQTTDTTAAVDRGALHRTVQFALLLVDGIDAAVGRAEPQRAPTPA